MSVEERKKAVQFCAIQPIGEAPAASHTPYASVCDMRMKCESPNVHVVKDFFRVTESAAVLSQFFIQCHSSFKDER